MGYQRDQKVCLRVFESWANRNLIKIGKLWVPEDDESEDRRLKIDLALEADGQIFAVEHTKVGPYAGFERDGAVTRKLENRIQDFSFLLEEFEYLSVSIPSNWIDIVRLRKFGDEISEAIPDALRELRILTDFPGNSPSLKRVICGLEVLFFLGRTTGNRRKVSVCILVESGLAMEEHRSSRFFRKLPSKSRKLQGWKARENAITFLILEDNDLQISNESLVASAAQSALRSEIALPDYVLYLDATYSLEWKLLPVCEFGVWNDRLYDSSDEERFWAVEPV